MDSRVSSSSAKTSKQTTFTVTYRMPKKSFIFSLFYPVQCKGGQFSVDIFYLVASSNKYVKTLSLNLSVLGLKVNLNICFEDQTKLKIISEMKPTLNVSTK